MICLLSLLFTARKLLRLHTVEKGLPSGPTSHILPRDADSLFLLPDQQQKQKSQGSTLIGPVWVTYQLLDQSTIAREVESCKKIGVPVVGVWERIGSQKKGGDDGKTLPSPLKKKSTLNVET